MVDAGSGADADRQACIDDAYFDNGTGVIAVRLDAALSQALEVVQLEDVEGLRRFFSSM